MTEPEPALSTELARANRTLRMVGSIHRAVVRAEDEGALLRETCRVLVETGGFRMAMVVFAEHDAGKSLRPVAHFGVEDGYAARAHLSWDERSERGRGPGGQAVRSGEPWLARNINADPAFEPWRADALQRGYRSIAALPLVDRGETLGALGVYASDPDAFDDTEVAVLSEVAADLAFGIGALRRRLAQLAGERRREADLRFAAKLDEVNRAMQGPGTLDAMMSAVLDAVLTVFDADRAFLMYPCDPDAASWSVPMERARPEFPGASAQRAVFPMTEEVAATLRPLLAADAPVTFGGDGGEPLPPGVAERFSIVTYLAMAVRPRVGKPWQLGVHQCRGARRWTADEVRLLQEIGRRIDDGLTTMLMLEQLRDSEARRVAAEDIAHLGYWRRECTTGELVASREVCRVAGFAEDATPQDPAYWAALVAPEDRARVASALAGLLQGGPSVNLELRVVRPDGSARDVSGHAEVERDLTGAPLRLTGTVQDVTEERQAAKERAFHLFLLECMDRINQAIRGAADLESMMGAALDVVLDVFACDRASLIFPCDPLAPTWRVAMERTRPEYPGVLALGVEVPMSPEVAEMHRRSLGAQRPFAFGPGTDLPLPPDLAELNEKSGVGMAIHPKLGPPWGFAVQQCSHFRVWSGDELRLFQEIGRRFGDGLTGLIAFRELRGSETYLRALVETIPDLVWVKDPQGVYLSCNPKFERLYGAPQAEIRGKTDYDFVDGATADFFRAHDRAAMDAAAPRVNDEWLRFAADGYHGLFETIKTPMYDPEGRLLGVLGVARDISERHRAEEELRVAATAFQAQEGIVITDANQVILRVNRAFTDITGYDVADIVGRTPRALRSGRHDADYYRAMWTALERDGYWQGEIWNRRKTGEVYPEWLAITAVTGAGGEVTHYVGTLIDITLRKAAEKEIERLAFYDPLTDLPNRRLLLDRLQHALTACARSGRKGALLFIDLDNFKRLNDTSGHDTGDRLLVEVARRLTGCVRASDTVARLGGDEFVVVIEDLSAHSSDAAAVAKMVAEEIRAALSRPYEVAGRVLHSTPSVGVTLFVERESAVEELVKQADIAMYQAKGAGRNAVRFYDPEMEAALAAQAALESALRVALRDGQFDLYYQPQVDGQRGLVGAEALLRWRHPERGLVLPMEFIGLAEETGLIRPIGQWVLETACAQLCAWTRVPRLCQVRVAINVSARQFRQRDFVAQVRRTLDMSGAPAHLLEIELTESLVLDDVDDTVAKMKALREVGVGFSIDDFGTGYSSLSYLTRLPLDQLKIDRSFVRNLPGQAGDAAVVQSIISLAHSLGLAVVAEGVETEEQRAFLAEHACCTWQGYLFGRPVPAAEFEARWAP